MKIRTVMMAVMLILILAPLFVLAADSEEKKDVASPPPLSRARVQALLAGDEGNTDTIWSLDEGSVVFASDMSFRLTEKTQYYAANGDSLTRLNFTKGSKVRYFLRDDVRIGLMIKLP